MGWIDLMGNVPMTQAQLDARNTELIRSKYSADRESMINRMLLGQVTGMYQMSPEEQALVATYSLWCKDVQGQRLQAREDSILLSQVLRYENAQERLARPLLSEGVLHVAGEPAVYDEETGELITEEIPEILGVDPLPETILVPVYDEETGEETGTQEVPNPLVVEDLAEREDAQNIIDAASAEVLTLAVQRQGL